MAKPVWRDVHGILLLDKPAGLSSNQALQKARRLFRADKAGHTGSLDPLATGLLPVCFGEATKIAGLLLGARKAYAAECALGVSTTTDDAEGEVLERRVVPPLDDEAIRRAAAGLTGRITQVPPVYSALKQGGEPLYRRARRGEDVVAPAREVAVYRFDLLGRAGDRLRLEVECGSGTYVRSLVRDLGERLGCGAHVTALRRLWVEPFMQPRMFTLERLEALAAEGEAALDACLLPLERGLAALPQLAVSATEAILLGQGRRPVRPGATAVPLACAIDPTGRLVALVAIGDGGEMRVLRGFNAVTAPRSPV
ncbi:tRNA pseudouridine(55) synthase TruB [Dokdonella fugitiva]|jgi:tRNA pseudouridine55 synthase|uniref:tRNA pseudouridine(55) synthase TruB n=1 Tax=Dokdonella fugitiva TaxID=328517 RepID=UPI0015F8D810|nr:tRNA pseudouridine(55) synthase TruB [Dokdonella fugitiva]MBA8885386.1 tRNA pseudouridine55 synthase [Dokdonella fugitiva]